MKTLKLPNGKWCFQESTLAQAENLMARAANMPNSGEDFIKEHREQVRDLLLHSIACSLNELVSIMGNPK